MPNNILRAERNGYAFADYSTFLRDASPALAARAREAALQYGGASCILYDPNDGDGGFLLVGQSWSVLADAWAEHMGEDFIS